MATNLIRHAGGGEIVLRPSRGLSRRPRRDHVGPRPRDGRRRAARCATACSTVGGAGNGLGAIGPPVGDVRPAEHAGPRHRGRRAPRSRDDAAVDGLALAMKGEEASAATHGGRCTTAPGPRSCWSTASATASRRPRAAAAAVRELRPGLDRPRRCSSACTTRCGPPAAPPRRSPGSTARPARSRFAGIGNIAATIVAGATTRSLVSMNGTLGPQRPPRPGLRLRARRRRAARHALRRLSAAAGTSRRYPGLVRRDPLVIASLLVRDFERGRDDVSVVVAKGDGAPE